MFDQKDTNSYSQEQSEILNIKLNYVSNEYNRFIAQPGLTQDWRMFIYKFVRPTNRDASNTVIPNTAGSINWDEELALTPQPKANPDSECESV